MNINEAFQLAAKYYQEGNLQQAEYIYREILQFQPNAAEGHYFLGIILQDKGQIDDAIICYQEAISMNPNDAEAHSNLGQLLQRKGQVDEAMVCYQKAIDIDPNLAGAHFNKALTLLLSGNFQQGWKEFEWRWKSEVFCSYNSCKRNFLQPLWDGSDINERTILLHAEQGFGDTIQFIRYAQLVRERGAKVILECQKELSSLLQNVDGIHRVVARGEKLPEFDLHCPLLSLPLFFDTTFKNIPARIPYVYVDNILIQNWKDKIQYDNSKLKLGLVWSGRLTHEQDHRFRSCSLDILSPLGQLNNITFYSLQKGEGARQAKYPPEGMRFFDYTDNIDNFSDTAAFIMNLDLIISVDTAVAHLAGALGKRVWILLPFVPDWRWLLNREDSPWYPTMRLFRQPSLGDWESVIAKVKNELQKLLDEK